MRSLWVASVLASLMRDGGLLAYSVVAFVGAPYFLRRKWRLLQKGRSDSEFDLAQWGIDWGNDAENAPGQSDKSGPRVAIVAASWGEVVTLEPLVKALRAARPNAHLTFSVQRREAIAAARLLSDDAVLPMPFDHIWPVARWLARARPDLVVFYEQFEWPTLARSLWAARVPFMVVHARVNSGRDIGYKRRLNTPAFWRWQLRGLRVLLLAAPSRRETIAPALPDEAQLKVVGSLKFPIARPQIAPAAEAALRAWIEAATQGAPLFVAGSTHATEEALVLDALEIVRRNYRGRAPLVLLAPRRLHRVEEVVRLLRERGVRVSRRSQWKGDGTTVDVLLLDTLGELNVAYRNATGAFVGGTLSGASHNVAEPLVWGVPVAYGPIRGNFEVEQLLCEEAGVGFRIHSPDELAAHWVSLLQVPELRDALGRKAEALVASQRGAFAQTLQTLIEVVDAVEAVDTQSFA